MLLLLSQRVLTADAEELRSTPTPSGRMKSAADEGVETPMGRSHATNDESAQLQDSTHTSWFLNTNPPDLNVKTWLDSVVSLLHRRTFTSVETLDFY